MATHGEGRKKSGPSVGQLRKLPRSGLVQLLIIWEIFRISFPVT
jgi:hypothetical protein